MAKHYERVMLEVEVKQRLEHTRDQLGLSSLSATVTYLIDKLPTKDRNQASSR